MVDHLRYLRRISLEVEPPLISREAADRARDVYMQLWEASDYRLLPPQTTVSKGGRAYYRWDCDDGHLAVEIAPDSNRVWWCWGTAKGGEQFGMMWDVGSPVDGALAEQLKLFTRAVIASQ